MSSAADQVRKPEYGAAEQERQLPTVVLEHAIGFSSQSYQPVHFLEDCDSDSSRTRVISDSSHAIVPSDQSSSYKDRTDGVMDMHYDYVVTSGAQLILSKFQDSKEQEILQEHNQAIVATAISTDKQMIATVDGSKYPSIIVWSRSGNRWSKLHTLFDEKSRFINVLDFSDDGRLLVSGQKLSEGHISVWDVSNGSLLSCVNNAHSCADISFGGRVRDLKKRPTSEYLFASCGTQSVTLWAINPESNKLLWQHCHTKLGRDFTCLDFSPDQELVFAGTRSGDFVVFSVRSLSSVFHQPCSVGSVNSIKVIPRPLSLSERRSWDADDRDPLDWRIVVAGSDGSLSFWEWNESNKHYDCRDKQFVYKGDPVSYITVNQPKVSSLMKQQPSLSSDPWMKKHRYDSGGRMTETMMDDENHTDNNQLTEFIGGTVGGRIFHLNSESTLKIESVNESQPLRCVKFDFSTDSSDRFLTLGVGGAIKIWCIEDYSVAVSHDSLTRAELLNGAAQIECHAASSTLSSSSTTSTVKSVSLDGSTCAVKTMLPAPTGLASESAYALSADMNDELAVVGFASGDIRAFNARVSGDPLWSIVGAHKSGVSSVRMSMNHKYLLSGGEHGSLRVWDTRYRNPVWNLKEHRQSISDMALFSDARRSLTVSMDRSLVCWDLSKGKSLSSHRRRLGGLNAVGLSADEQSVFTVGSDRALCFWDLRQSEPVHTSLEIHGGNATSLAVGPLHTISDGILATVGADCVLKMWDIRQSIKPLSELHGHSLGINDVQFSPDGRQIVTVGQDSNILIWNVY